MIRDIVSEDFENDVVNVKCLRGASIADVKSHMLGNLETLNPLSHIIVHVGTNDGCFQEN